MKMKRPRHVPKRMMTLDYKLNSSPRFINKAYRAVITVDELKRVAEDIRMNKGFPDSYINDDKQIQEVEALLTKQASITHNMVPKVLK